MPPRALVHIEQVVHDYLVKEMCDGRPPKGKFDLFPVEGGTAAMCYIFDSLLQNGLLKQGDTIALFLPTFTPYIEIAHLERFNFKIVAINANSMRADGTHDWHYPASEIAKLENPKIKLAVTVNPSNPPSVAFSPVEMKQIVRLIRKNPNLVLVTDDVYVTFVPNFRSLMAEVPHNTICVYSFEELAARAGAPPRRDRDPRDEHDGSPHRRAARIVEEAPGQALRGPDDGAQEDQVHRPHGGRQPQRGLEPYRGPVPAAAGPDGLLRAVPLARSEGRLQAPDHGDRAATRLLVAGPGHPHAAGRSDARLVLRGTDFAVWAKVMYGDAFVKYMVSNYEPVDFLFRLAEKSGVVLMDGGGFGGPPWSIRISLANLDDGDYAKIGKYMVEAATEYVDAWKASALVRSGPTAGKGQKVKVSAAKRATGAKKAGATVARKAVKQAVKKADTAAKSAKKGAAK